MLFKFKFQDGTVQVIFEKSIFIRFQPRKFKEAPPITEIL